MIKSVKRLGAAVLSAVMMLTAVATPLGDNLPAVRESTSLTAGADSYWVGSSTYGYYANNSTALNEVKAIMSKNCLSSEIARFNKILSEFPLSGYFNSYKTKACSWHCSICTKDINELKKMGCRSSFYDDETGKTVSCSMTGWNNAIQCAGYAVYCYYRFMGKTTADTITLPKGFTQTQLKSAFSDKTIRTGAHFRKASGHSLCYLTRDDNYIYFIDANAGYNSATGCGSKDSNGHYKTCCKINLHKYTYADFVKSCSSGKLTIYNSSTSKFDNGSTPSTDNVKLTGTSCKIANTVSDTNAFVVTDVYKPSNYKLTKAGIRIRRYDDSYDNGWLEFHNTASTWTGYDYMYISYDMNSEVKITLRHGTKYYYKFYAVIEGKEYWSPEQSFTTTGSHSYGSWYTKTSATCTSGGTEERKCSCGATESRSTSALGHNYGSWSTVTSATCTSGGSEKRTCSRCSNSETRSTSALGHNYGSTYFEADHPHKYAHLCQRCGYKEFTGGNLAIYEKCDICYNENLPSKPCLNISSNGFKESDNVSFTWDPTDKTTHYNLTVEVLSGDEYKTVCRETYVNSGFQTTFGKGQYRAVLDSYNSNMFHQYTSDWRDWVHNSSDYVYFDIECAHEFLEEVVSPTYDNEGYTLHTCTKCGYSYKDNYTPALKLTELTGVKVKTQGSTSLTLAWDKNASASGYVVEQYKGGKWTQIAKTSSNATVTYTVNGLAADTTYTFRIKAYAISGKSEIYSDYVRIAGKTRIANVASFKGSAVSASAVKLDWSKNDKATGYVIEQYKGGKWTAIATTKNNTTLTFTVKGLAEGTAYSFRIKSFRKTGSTTDFSEYTAIKAATLLDSVSNLKVTSVTGSWITLEWAKNDKATGYSIEQYKGGKWTVIATTKNNTTLKFTVKGLKNDTTYSFRIRAYKTAGVSNVYSDYVRIAGKTRIPNVATFKGSAASASAVKLDWSKNDKATGYVIEQYKGGKWTVLATTKNNTTLSFTVKGLAKGTTYSFRIKSFRKTGSTIEFSEYASVKAATDK